LEDYRELQKSLQAVEKQNSFSTLSPRWLPEKSDRSE
jgi:hypothetical protein